MIKHFDKPHKIAFTLTVLLIILTFITYILFGDSAIDIQMHDTYFILAYYHIMISIVSFYGFISLVYWLFRNRNLNSWLTRFHLLFSFSPILVIVYMLQFFLSMKDIPRRYYSFQGYDSNYSLINNIVVQIAIMTLLITQILLLINIIGSYFRTPNIEKEE